MNILSCVFGVFVALTVLNPSSALFSSIGDIKAKFGLGGYAGSSVGYNGNYGGGYAPKYVPRSNVGYGGYSTGYSGGYNYQGYQGPQQNGQVVRLIRVIAPTNYPSSGYAPGYYGSTYNYGQSSVSASVSPQVVQTVAQVPTQPIQVQVPQVQPPQVQVQQVQVPQVQFPQYQVQVPQPRPVLVQVPQQLPQQTINYAPAVATTPVQVGTPVFASAPIAAPAVLQTYVPGTRTSQSISSSSASAYPRYYVQQYSRAVSPPITTVRLIYSNAAGDNSDSTQQYSSSATSSSVSSPGYEYGAPPRASSSAEYSASTSYGNNGAAHAGC